MKKTLILLRHGSKNIDDRLVDSGLNHHGRIQSKTVVSFYLERFSQKHPDLVSSERLRCQETLVPMSERLGVDVQIDPHLTEQKTNESHQDFVQRMLRFKKGFEDSENPVTVACTHGDWIPLFTDLTIKKMIHPGYVGWIELVYEDEKYELQHFEVSVFQ